MEEPAEYVSERLRSRLAEDGRVNALGVEVTVRGRDVFLAGTVETAERRRAVVEVAQEELPDFVIHDGLAVTELVDAPGAEDVG
ncbi:MAG TPA: BON domain-containing protein [Miltoncostaeaceae bacterium]|jgi:hypothetical protein|nr:BON domain-containing protein [Miltoncostaeaceae bacterium]